MSIDLNRHAPQGSPGGVGLYASSTQLALDRRDPRDAAASTTLEIEVGADVASRLPLAPRLAEIALPIRIRAEFSPAAGPTKVVTLEGGKETSSRSHFADDAMAAIHLLEALPIVVIPERRRFPPDTSWKTIPSVREDLVEPAALPETLLGWYCESPSKFKEWESIVSDLLGATLTVKLRPSQPSTLAVAIGSDPARPVEDIGCGIAELMNLGQALVRHGGGLLLFEEPELHLHPTIQRRLVQVLEQQCRHGNWQALLSTHSNHMLDQSSESISIFAVGRVDGASVLTDASPRSEQYALLETLGVRPSSVLQANSVIWVEGPSDAIYLRFFLMRRAQQTGIRLREFSDFAFAFFGGALLRHASVAVAPIPDLVHLLSVHPKSFVVVDADRTSSLEDLGKEYTREFLATASPERVWVSAGREVENYLRDEVLIWSVTDLIELAAGQELPSHINRQYDVFSEQAVVLRDALSRARAAHDCGEKAKVQFAKLATEMMANNAEVEWTTYLDLTERLDTLLAFVVGDQRAVTPLVNESVG